MSKHIFEYDEKCKSCDGTGIYVGFAEHDGIGVICHNCNGTGKKHNVIKWEDFGEREERENIKRVIMVNPGIACGIGNGHSLADFGGMDYKKWFLGGKFPIGSEMRNFVCPAWWYQCADYEKKPDWAECIKCGPFSNCPHFKNKDKCWQKWDKEHE